MDLVLGRKIFILAFIILKISKFPASPPPFENPAYATALGSHTYLSTFENAKSGGFLPANSIAGKFRPTDLFPVSAA